MTGRDRSTRGAHAPEATSEKAYWARLYEQCHDQVQAYFARHVRCSHDAEDLAQEVFADLIAHGANLGMPEMYVRTVVRHQLYAYWRRRKRRALAVERMEQARRKQGNPDALHTDNSRDPFARLVKVEMRQQLMTMITQLSPGYAEVLRLRFIQGLKPREAAAQAGCSHEAMEKRLTRAKHSLRRLCEDRLHEQATAHYRRQPHGSSREFLAS